MALMLVAVQGRYKGWAWEIPPRGLQLGRGPENDVVIIDPLVSRRHCKLSLVSESEARLEDLGSMNPLLVNGVPLREGLLHLGDDLVAGSARFILGEDALSAMQALVTHAAVSTPSPSATADQDRSISIGAPQLSVEAIRGRRAIPDMVFLQESARLLGSCSTFRELAGVVEKRLYERFNPASVWIALVGDGGSILYLRDNNKHSAPAELIAQALRKREGVLAAIDDSRGTPGYTFVAPVMRRGVPDAIIALQTASAAGAHDEEELRLFVLFAQTLEPFLHLVLANERLLCENERLSIAAGESRILVGENPVIRAIREQIVQAAEMGLGVLISGEPGVGKHLVARMIHARSLRARFPLVIAHCAALTPEAFEREWRGYKKGGFPEAATDCEGLVARSHLGTLLLEEPGALSPENQMRVLDTLTKGSERRVGSHTERFVDFRVISVTTEDLGGRVQRGEFDQRLYQRLSAAAIALPPLRERTEDITALARFFLEENRLTAKCPVFGFEQGFADSLAHREWPGNVRELREVVLQSVRKTKTPVVSVPES